MDENVAGFEELGTRRVFEFLKPTKIYVKTGAVRFEKAKSMAWRISQEEDSSKILPRMMPEGLGVEIELGSWPVLPVFDLLKEKGELQTVICIPCSIWVSDLRWSVSEKMLGQRFKQLKRAVKKPM